MEKGRWGPINIMNLFKNCHRRREHRYMLATAYREYRVE